MMNIDSIKNDHESWKNPEEFLPERHLNVDGNITKTSAFAAFGGGNNRKINYFSILFTFV